MNMVNIQEILNRPAEGQIINVKTKNDSKPPYRVMEIDGGLKEGLERAHEQFRKLTIFPKDHEAGRRVPLANNANNANNQAVAPPRVVVNKGGPEDAARNEMLRQAANMTDAKVKEEFWGLIARMNTVEATNWMRTQTGEFIKAKDTEKFINSLNLLETEIFKRGFKSLMNNLITQGFKYNVFIEKDNPDYDLEKTSNNTLQMISSSIIANGKDIYQEAFDSHDTFQLWANDMINSQDFIRNLPVTLKEHLKIVD